MNIIERRASVQDAFPGEIGGTDIWLIQKAHVQDGARFLGMALANALIDDKAFKASMKDLEALVSGASKSIDSRKPGTVVGLPAQHRDDMSDEDKARFNRELGKKEKAKAEA